MRSSENTSLPIIYTSLCTEKIQADFKRIAVFNAVSWKIFLIYTYSQVESHILFRGKQERVLKVGTELCMLFTCSSDYAEGKQNCIWFSKYEAKHTHYIYNI